jgi:hypothetical protein
VWVFWRPPTATLKKLSKAYASVDNLKPVAQRERQGIIDTKNSTAMYYIIVDASVRCTVQYAVVRQKKTIDMDGWILLSLKTQSLQYGNSLDWDSHP